MPKKLPRSAAHVVTRAEMARRLGVTPSAVTQACRPGGPLAPALVGKGVNVLHEAAKAWLARKAAEQATVPIDVASCEPDESTVTPTGTAEETEAALGPWRAQVDLASLEEPLTALTEKYGDFKEFQHWVMQRKHLAAARREEMLQARVAGRLIARTTVERMVQKVDEAFRLMLTDAPRSIATQIAPTDMARCTQVVRDSLEQILTKGRDQMLMSLQADDPLAPLMEAAE